GEIAGLFEDLWALGKPTIARVQGYALAGGFGLALACDFLVAASDAVFGTPEIDVGLWPFMITVPLLRAMAPKQALELMMTARRVGADEGLRMGFVNRVVPPPALDGAVALAAKSPAVMRLGRTTFYRVVDDLAARALPYLHSQLTVNAGFEDAAEGVAAFKEKRAPQAGTRRDHRRPLTGVVRLLEEQAQPFVPPLAAAGGLVGLEQAQLELD